MKRQREMAKKQKRADKAQRLAARKVEPGAQPAPEAKPESGEEETERRSTLRVFVAGSDVEYSKK